jgi:hypothetical protein
MFHALTSEGATVAFLGAGRELKSRRTLIVSLIISILSACASDDRSGSIAPNAARVLQQRMSVAPRKRQLATKVRRVVKGHKETHALQQRESVLFDHLVRSGEERRRNRQPGAFGRFLNWRDLFERLSGAHHDFRGYGQAKRPRRLEIDCQIKSRGLLDRQIAGLSTLQNFVHICRGTAKQIRDVCSITRKRTSHCILPGSCDGQRQPIIKREFSYAPTITEKESVAYQKNCTQIICLPHRIERSLDILRPLRFPNQHCHPDLFC